MSLVEEESVEDAARRSKEYFDRQLYKLRYPIICIVGLMSGFSLYQEEWIPFLSLNLFSLCFVVGWYVFLVLMLGKSFLELNMVEDPKQFDNIYEQYNIIISYQDDPNAENGELIKEHESVQELESLLKVQIQQEAKEEIYKRIKQLCWTKFFFFIIGSYWTTVSIGNLVIGG